MNVIQARAAYQSWQRVTWACFEHPGCPPGVRAVALEWLMRARLRLLALESGL